jgi:hypothetical protein
MDSTANPGPSPGPLKQPAIGAAAALILAAMFVMATRQEDHYSRIPSVLSVAAGGAIFVAWSVFSRRRRLISVALIAGLFVPYLAAQASAATAILFVVVRTVPPERTVFGIAYLASIVAGMDGALLLWSAPEALRFYMLVILAAALYACLNRVSSEISPLERNQVDFDGALMAGAAASLIAGAAFGFFSTAFECHPPRVSAGFHEFLSNYRPVALTFILLVIMTIISLALRLKVPQRWVLLVAVALVVGGVWVWCALLESRYFAMIFTCVAACIPIIGTLSQGRKELALTVCTVVFLAAAGGAVATRTLWGPVCSLDYGLFPGCPVGEWRPPGG